ncbi:hypothetical protein DFR42_11240 [Undibacterium pigrum]|uniref:Uncharacterized protein n=2 Tax=Undibacterium pigrum TaxID=401470 RepID=A0A318J3K7_9BURK|nr:hypothetical protein DFR42_11240 [Undibacterium pigrum]
MNLPLQKKTSNREIFQILENADRASAVAIIMARAEVKLFRHYLARWTDVSNSSILDWIAFSFLQLRIFFTCQKLIALAPLYDPEHLDKISFFELENKLVKVIFNPVD